MGGQANGNRPRTRTAWLTDPFILDSLGSGMDGTNQKCKSRKRSRETDRSATTRRLVSEEFWAWATTHAAARTRNSRGSHQPPESLLYSMDSAYPLSINKMRNGEERKERGLYWRGFAPEIRLMKIRVWAFEKMKMQRVKRKSFEQPTWHKDSSQVERAP